MSEMSEHDWAHRVETQLIPMIKEAAMVSLIPPGEDPDVKVAVELGMTLLLDKPLILIVPEDRWIPVRLRRAADAVVEWSDDSAEMQRRMQEAMDGLTSE